MYIKPFTHTHTPHTAQAFPTSVRTTGPGVTTAFARVGGMLSPFLVSYLFAWSCSIGTWYLVCSINLISVSCGNAHVMTVVGGDMHTLESQGPPPASKEVGRSRTEWGGRTMVDSVGCCGSLYFRKWNRLNRGGRPAPLSFPDARRLPSWFHIAPLVPTTCLAARSACSACGMITYETQRSAERSAAPWR